MVYNLSKDAMHEIPPSSFVILRFSLALPFMFIATYITCNTLWLPRKHLLLLIVNGVVAVVANQSLITYALTITSAINASIITAPCTPIFTTALSVMRGTDKMTIPKGVGFLCALVGALILLKVEDFSLEGNQLGDLLLIIVSFVASINTLLQRKLLDDGVHPIGLMAHSTLYGLLSYLICFSYFDLFQQEKWRITQANTIVDFVVVAILATALPWCTTTFSLKVTSPMTVSIYVVLQPPMSALVGLFIGDGFTPRQGLGTIIVLLGLIFVNANQYREKVLWFIQHHILGRVPADFQALPEKEKEEETQEIEMETYGEEGGVEGVSAKDGAEVIYVFEKTETNMSVNNNGNHVVHEINLDAEEKTYKSCFYW